MTRRIQVFLFHLCFFLTLSVGAQNTRLAIGTFGLTPESRNGDLADLVAVHLSVASKIELVERRELNAALKEAGLSLAGVVRPKDAVRLGGILRADQFLLGSSAVIDETNRIFIRLVDAKTGAILAIKVFCDTDRNLEALAAGIADFARAKSSQPVTGEQDYLAIGVVQDLGVNNRFADFPAQMRGTVAANLSGTATVLERDVVSYLANEMQLDMAGLTDKHGKQTAQNQFAFWIVDGFYQSYEVDKPEVQVMLRVERVNGGQRNFTVQGKPDEQFFTKISDTIRQALKQSSGTPITPVSPDRHGDIATLEARGDQLASYTHNVLFLIWDTVPYHDSIDILTARNPEKVMSGLDEATRVFESILLLDPENNAAKMRLAGCLLFKAEMHGGTERDHLTERIERADEYYREVIATEDPVYADDARVNLALSTDGIEGVELLRRFSAEATDPKKKARFDRHRSELLHFLEHTQPVEKVLPQLRLMLLDQIAGVQKNSADLANFSFDDVLDGYRYRQDQREEIVNKLLPELLDKFPDLRPYLLLAAVAEQTSTNSPVTQQFLASLNNSAEHPESVWLSSVYFTHLTSTSNQEDDVHYHGGQTLYQHTFENHQYAVVIAEALARSKAAERGLAPPLTEIGKHRLAESYLALNQWKDALGVLNELADATPEEKNACLSHLGMAKVSVDLPDDAWSDKSDLNKVDLAYQCAGKSQWPTAIRILESIGHRTVRMNRDGPWGDAFAPVLPTVVADSWRTQAAMPQVKDPKRFELPEKPYVFFEPEGIRLYSITVEGDDLWMVTYSQIKCFRGNGPFTAANPSELHEFNRATKSAPTCICVGSDYIWAGTYDDGLIELDRKTGVCHRFTTQDGLFLNRISSLKMQGQTLWIAYANNDNGAVGVLDLKSHKFSSFTPNLSLKAGNNSQPGSYEFALDRDDQAPTLHVTGMVPANSDEMCFAVADKGVRCFHHSSGAWNSISLPRPPYIFGKAAVDIADVAMDGQDNLLLLATREYGVLDGEKSTSGGLMVYDVRQNKIDTIQIYQGLPSNDVTAVAVDGNIAWVGGRGFVAVLDIKNRTVRRIAYLSARVIDQIQLGHTHAYIAVSCGEEDSDHAGKARTGVYRIDRSSVER